MSRRTQSTRSDDFQDRILPEPDEQVRLSEDRQGDFKSGLDAYLKLNKLSTRAIARCLGMPLKSVFDWANARHVPSLEAAYEIERITKGAVPMESWLAHPTCKSQIAKWRGLQPETNRQQPSVIPAGGYATPHKPPKRKDKSRAKDQTGHDHDEDEMEAGE